MRLVDLHGVKHKDVESTLINACSKYEAPFIVITGKSRKMKELAANAVAKFKLSTRDMIDNPGRVIVYEGR